MDGKEMIGCGDQGGGLKRKGWIQQFSRCECWGHDGIVFRVNGYCIWMRKEFVLGIGRMTDGRKDLVDLKREIIIGKFMLDYYLTVAWLLFSSSDKQ